MPGGRPRQEPPKQAIIKEAGKPAEGRQPGWKQGGAADGRIEQEGM
ncbi:MAG: hypothetical protein FWG42_09980 [Clostridiales bacterium]|nr:hypothetical protein [Clostridiales bacterium]